MSRLYTADESRELDRLAIEEHGIPAIQLMSRAGEFTYNVLRSAFEHSSRIRVFCGSGNNAGDGYIVAGFAARDRLDVDVIQVGDRQNLSESASRAFKWMCDQGVSLDSRLESAPEVVVDALLGTGTTGTVRGSYVEAIRQINDTLAKTVAVDIPSGIDATTGEKLTKEPVRADITATFIARKTGLYLRDGASYCGEIFFDSLDVPEAVYDAKLGIAEIPTNPNERTLPRRQKGAYKNLSGHILVVGGERQMGGAAILTAEAALRTGAGLVSLATREEHVSPALARLPELMVRGIVEPVEINDAIERADVIAIGPGLGTSSWSEALLVAVCEAKKPTVIDADALNLIAKKPSNVLRPPHHAILTPHPGEARRLLNDDTLEGNPIVQCTQLSSIFNAVIVLKGASTLVGVDGCIHGICNKPNPALATAGSGDVLTGIIAASLATVSNPTTAASLGVWLHSQAGHRATSANSTRAIIASDLIDSIRPWE